MHLVQTMAYAGEVPWHGLGNHLSPSQPIEVWATQAGMDWTIRVAEVRFATGVDDSDGLRNFPDQKVHYRSDSSAPLSVVSKRYQAVQPGEIGGTLSKVEELVAEIGHQYLTKTRRASRLAIYRLSGCLGIDWQGFHRGRTSWPNT